MWRECERFPTGQPGGTVVISEAAPSGEEIRPFGLRFVRYARTAGSPRPVMTWCPDRQIGLIDGKPSFTCEDAPSMTKYDTDGKDVLVVDYAEDD